MSFSLKVKTLGRSIFTLKVAVGVVVVEVTEDMGVEAVVSAQMVVPSSPTVSFLRRLLTTQGNMLLLPLRLITGEWPLLHLRRQVEEEGLLT